MSNRARVRSAASVAILATFAWAGTRELVPPSPRSSDAPAAEFSAGRAMGVVRDVAARPHPVGSAEHARVRDTVAARFRALGLEVDLRAGTVFGSARGEFVRAARIENVVARLRGPASLAPRARPVLLAAHYDSVPTGPGAGDDAAGVATLLETARALSVGPPLPGDVIFLVTDGEELDLFGARAAVLDRELLASDPIVLNFEARGHRGPSVMFETSAQNTALITAYASAVPDPVANSLTFDVYKRLPNDTDFTVFRAAGLEGLNFAFIGGLSHYHTMLDAPDALDPGSLQQHGGAALALTRRLVEAPPERSEARGDSIYFTVARSLVVRYPAAWRWPLAIVALLALAAAVSAGILRGNVGASALAKGVLLQSLSISAAAAIAWAISTGVCAEPATRSREQVALLHDGGRFMLGILLLAFGVHCALPRLLRAPSRVEIAWSGGLAIPAALLVLVAIELPGGSFAFTWPIVFGAIGLLLRHLRRDRFASRPVGFAVEALLVLPAPLLLAALPWHLFEAMTLSAAPAVAALFVVLLGLITPQLADAAAVRPWRLPTLAAAAGIAVLGHATWNLGVDERRPLADSILYACDADLGTAVHASFDAVPDEWTAQILGSSPERRALVDFLPLLGARELLVSEATWLPIRPPSVEVTPLDGDAVRRRLRVHVVPGDGTRRISIELPRDRSARLTALDGVLSGPGAFRGVVYEGPAAAGFDAEFEVAGGAPVVVSVVASRDGVPAAPPRPPWIIPAPNLPDTTLVRVTARG